MESISRIYDFIISSYGIYGTLLLIVFLALFILQLYYYLGFYKSIYKYKNSRRQARGATCGLSVITIVREEPYYYLETMLPRILEQENDAFEVIVVCVGVTEDFADKLERMKNKYFNLVTTKMESDPRFPISNKMAYNVGIKAASYDNIILTTADAAPVSPKWLDCMEKGFCNGEVVIAYCGLEPGAGLANKIMRTSRLFHSVRFLSSAVKGNPYKGSINNIGFTKQAYFGNKGFDHLNMNIGEEDLFIQKIARRENTSVIMNPHATVWQTVWGGLEWWRNERYKQGSTFKFYPLSVKAFMEWETVSRLLFYIVAVVCLVIFPLEIRIGVAVIMILRWCAVFYSYSRFKKRLGERKTGMAPILYDVSYPITELFLTIKRKFRSPPGVWR